MKSKKTATVNLNHVSTTINDMKATGTSQTIDSLQLKNPEITKKIELTTKWILSRPWSDEVQFIILYGSVAQGYARFNSDIDLAIGITGNTKDLIEIRKELILKKPYEDLDIRIFEHLPIYIQKDVLKGLILYCREIIELYDVAYKTIKKYRIFKPYLDDYIGIAPLP